MWLARLLLVGASIFASSATKHLRSDALVRVQRLGDNAPATLWAPNFHERDQQIPDVQDQDFKTTMKCTEERKALAEELNELLAARAELDKECQMDLDHYRYMNAVTDGQIKRLKPIVADRTDESDLPPFYREKYSAIMCQKLYDGLLGRDKKVRLEVYNICDGKKSLTECELERWGDVDIRPPGVDWAGYVKKNDTNILRRLRMVAPAPVPAPAPAPAALLAVDPCPLPLKMWSAVVEAKRASPECFQAKAVQDQVDSIRKSKLAKEKSCQKEELKLKGDLRKKKREEDALWTEYHGHITQKEPIKKKEAQQVAKRFCGAVHTYRENNQCNSDRKLEMEDFYRANCLP